ncbi:MAG: hypothetical protein ACOY0T_13640, partial [Myxococcota bacterium]
NLTWLLYYATALEGPYALVRQGVTNGASTSSSREMLQSAGLAAPIVVGGYYLVGVGVPTTHTFFIEEGSTPRVASFAQILGSFSFPSSAFPEPTLPAPSSVQIGVNDVDSGIWSAFTTTAR